MFTDLLVIVVYFLAIFCIGIYAGRRQNSLTDYALGNRSLPWWAILASILAAEISAATFLGAPGEGYHTRNFTYAQLCIGTILGRIIVGKLFLKPYYDYKVVSIYEYLEKRFGLLTRRTASMVFLVSRVLASGTRLYFAGILLVIAYQFMTDTTADANQIVLLYIAALVVISIATTIYTAIGGLKAVVWTDVLQAVVLGVSMLSALWVLFSHIPGGWNSISAAMNGGDDWKFFSWGTKEGLDFLQQCAHVLGQEYTVWAAFLGATFITMATHGTDKDMVQRMLAAKSSKAGTRAVIVSGLLDFPIVIVFLFTGILLYVFYQYNPASLPADTPQLHVFPYSERPGTAALSIPYVVDDKEKKRRVHELLELSDQKTRAFYARHAGTEQEVLLEKSASGKAMHGFTRNYVRVQLPEHLSKPEYDNELLTVRIGDFNADQTAMMVEDIIQR